MHAYTLRSTVFLRSDTGSYYFFTAHFGVANIAAFISMESLETSTTAR